MHEKKKSISSLRYSKIIEIFYTCVSRFSLTMLPVSSWKNSLEYRLYFLGICEKLITSNVSL